MAPYEGKKVGTKMYNLQKPASCANSRGIGAGPPRTNSQGARWMEQGDGKDARITYRKRQTLSGVGYAALPASSSGVLGFFAFGLVEGVKLKRVETALGRTLDNRKSVGDLMKRIFKRSASPALSTQGNSPKSWMRNIFSKSTSSLPQATSMGNPGGGAALSPPIVVTPDGISPNRASLMADASQYQGHRTPPASFGSRTFSTSPAAPDLQDLSSLKGPTQTSLAGEAPDLHDLSPLQGSTQTSLTGEAPGENTFAAHGYPSLTPYNPHEGGASNPAGVEDNSQSGNRQAGSSVQENLRLTGRALLMLLPKAANIVDTNPAKVALGLVNAIIEIKNAVKDNKDAVARQIASTGGQLQEVADALDGWGPVDKEETPWMNHFNTALEEGLQELKGLSDESNFRKFLDHEDEQGRIKDIFVRINEARVRFELAMGIRVFRAVYDVDKTVKVLLLDRLEPSRIAHHDYILEGKEGRMLRRQVCTPGTRVGILDGIVRWAQNTSPDSPDVYWLFGHAGSGKSTLAYTIARRFEFAGNTDDTIILGGNFFCSRQFEETSLSKYIIRTIVYHLALKCKPFSDALVRSGRLDTITQNLRTQLDNLLVKPWQESEAARRTDTLMPPHYLIVIDALDEIDGTGGSDFLRALVDTINKINKKGLSDLKFFVTSRSDESLVKYVESLQQKRLYCLQDVKQEEASADIVTYLKASLPHFKGPGMDQLVEQADGLFIYAATVVKLDPRSFGVTKQHITSISLVPASRL
ncbi:hypothetical protein D9619_006668 [Psilocybe cf. subviscida]|uniref:Nephrocystin 3-like N-terminal domain-containing protein n=1 Tax=Psilocybe cf. subviscida TaxID=2480587 RepID=A0A8H5B3P2_9AGAR|nr:hypothetical protein D9619_006668 [Psilocybe cf. subviscida]